jgi:two-component system NtrC family sensor kinase
VATIPRRSAPKSLLAFRLSVVLSYGFVGALLLVIFLTIGVEPSMRRGLRVLFLVGAFLGALGLGFILDGLVTRPVQHLVQQVRGAVGHGWSEALEVPRWRGEITELGNALEELRSAMVEKHEALGALNLDLEDRVRRRSEELEQAQAQVIEAGKLAGLGQMATGVAHEVNNPTGIVLSRVGYLLSIGEEEGVSEEILADLKVIEDQARRISKITRGLLDFSRPAESVYAQVDLLALCQGVIELLQHKATSAGVGLSLDSRSAGQGATCWGSGDELDQVVFNLVANAVDATESKGQVILRPAPGSLEVIDTGSGIRKANLGHLFEPFFTTKEPGKGTGLGLSISWAIVTSHGGTIEVDSTEGSGTTMRVILPLSEVAS